MLDPVAFQRTKKLEDSDEISIPANHYDFCTAGIFSSTDNGFLFVAARSASLCLLRNVIIHWL